MSQNFTHIDADGNPTMVDVGDKAITRREATARTVVVLPTEVLDLLADEEIHTRKGPVFQTAILAGIMAVKKTSELIPLCHPLQIDTCGVDITPDAERRIIIECTVRMSGKTGVEMEALTGASVAALTIYDMCKAFSHDILIQETRLMKKSGGKSDFNAGN
jgi:cyclic pyranopterin phosphate synthase